MFIEAIRDSILALTNNFCETLFSFSQCLVEYLSFVYIAIKTYIDFTDKLLKSLCISIFIWVSIILLQSKSDSYGKI